MPYVNKVTEITKKIIRVLQEVKDRDEKIVQVEQLLLQRQELLDQFKPPYTVEQKLVGRELIELNKQLNFLLTREKTVIQQDIKSLQQKKETSEKYTNPYESLNTDGVFYDQRK